MLWVLPSGVIIVHAEKNAIICLSTCKIILCGRYLSQVLDKPQYVA